ncbi:hypothetical protein RF55_21453 [Lasius niger]|uniref:Uncharacterized protein n=1 Tax=Lasius niger TaxID=67767 RepID=A0A0J7JXT5_LASNI|nr:hypothetical protein RF55_21453 [Lasius niger]
MPALPANRLMPYSTHLTRKRELSYTTTERALKRLGFQGRRAGIVAMLLPVVIKKPRRLARAYLFAQTSQPAWLESQSMRRSYQLGGSVVRAASFSSPP